MLARLDAAGILVWQEIGPWEPAGRWRADTPAQIAAARDRALRAAEAGQAHPSILAWTLTNEVAGNGQPGQQEYVRQTAPRLRELDPDAPGRGRPVGRACCPARAGPLFAELDAIGVTDYVGWYEGLDLDAAGQAALDARAHRASCAACFPASRSSSPSSARPAARASRARRSAACGFQAELLARRMRELRDEPGPERDDRLVPARLRAATGLPRRLGARAAARPDAHAGPQREGPVRLRGPAEARAAPPCARRSRGG